ncbi:MAG TPA: ATP-binding protein [Kofleriaceae bacterium]|nr:ATP-binding protein [Kofleriaceae bacterium]
MNLGIGSRLLLTSLAVVIVLELLAAIALRIALHRTVEAQVITELERHAASARAAVVDLPGLDGEAGRVVITRIAAATDTDIAVVRGDGEQLARSADEPLNGDPLERPEIRDALDPQKRRGVARRDGRVLVALPMPYGDGTAVVRVSAGDDAIAAAQHRIYRILGIGAVLGLMIAIGITLVTTTLVRRQVRRLADSAGAVASGGARRIALDGAGGELHLLGASFNQVAADGERAVNALAAQRSLLASVLDSLTQGVIAVDADQRILVVNPAARALLELPGVPLGEPLIDHVRVPALLDALEGDDDDRTAEFTTAAGARVVARVARRRGGDGHILVLEDMTAIRRLETIRRDFVANASHELRTPVSVIRANAETLEAGAKDEPAIAGRLLEGISRNAMRLSHLVVDLLDLSKIESGQMKLERAPVEVAAAAADARASVDELARRRQVTIAVEVAGEPAIRGDASALDQILVNLVDNAVKYNQPGGHVWIRARRAGDRVRIEVADDGPGIAPHQRERVFERFYRVDPGRSRELGGTGLGLSIVKHLVEAMGGRIGVDAHEPRGALFWVELPAA